MWEVGVGRMEEWDGVKNGDICNCTTIKINKQTNK